jgi:small ligand-binding sensory domain FIST
MRFQSLLSETESAADAVEELIDSARDAGVGATDVAFVFFTAHHREDAAEIVERIWLELDPQCVIGCSAEGVIGADREVERSPGLALLVGQTPGVRIHPFHIAVDDWRNLLADAERMSERLGLGPSTRAIIGLGDPWTTPLEQFMKSLDERAPKSPLIGGMASAARAAGENVLVRNDEVYDEGFVGLSLSGPIDVQTVVSQGCRPLGTTFVITKAHDNVIEQLGGRPAVEVLRDMIMKLPEREQALLQNGLFVGRAISEY